MILGIESSADFPSVAIIDLEGNVLKEWISPEKQSHSEKLPIFVQQALEYAKEQSLEIQAVALNSGPGSYTGLRIGGSLAKGLCYALSLKLISVNGIQAMAKFLKLEHPEIQCVWSMLDARRDEVFMCIGNPEGEFSEITAQILTADFASTVRNSSVGFIGNANEKASRICELNVMYALYGPYTHQWAKTAATLFQQQKFEDVAYFEPFYLKDFVPGISKKFTL